MREKRNSVLQWELLVLVSFAPRRLPSLDLFFGEDSDDLLVLEEAAELVIAATAVGVDFIARLSPAPPGRWPASWRAFFSRSSLGNSRDTTSPAERPSWISAKKKSETPTFT